MPKPRLLGGWLACALLFVGGAAFGRPPPPQQWRSEIDRLVGHDDARPPPQHGVLFVGSSSIRMWTTLARNFPGVPVISRGFGGSTIADSTYYADRIIAPYHPRLIVMYAGDNDIDEGCTPRQVFEELEAFVARVRHSLPHATIVYISIKPSIARAPKWPQMREANREIEAWARTQKQITYVDVATKMLDAHGKPKPELFREDGLHMSRAGYAIWIEALKPVLARNGFVITPR